MPNTVSTRRKPSTFAVIITLAAIILLITYVVVGWFWERHNMPSTLLANSSWDMGMIHGIYLPFNLVVSSLTNNPTDTIFQAGERGWYSFWYAVGVSTTVTYSKVWVR